MFKAPQIKKVCRAKVYKTYYYVNRHLVIFQEGSVVFGISKAFWTGNTSIKGYN